VLVLFCFAHKAVKKEKQNREQNDSKRQR